MKDEASIILGYYVTMMRSLPPHPLMEHKQDKKCIEPLIYLGREVLLQHDLSHPH